MGTMTFNGGAVTCMSPGRPEGRPLLLLPWELLMTAVGTWGMMRQVEVVVGGPRVMPESWVELLLHEAEVEEPDDSRGVVVVDDEMLLFVVDVCVGR